MANEIASTIVGAGLGGGFALAATLIATRRDAARADRERKAAYERADREWRRDRQTAALSAVIALLHEDIGDPLASGWTARANLAAANVELACTGDTARIVRMIVRGVSAGSAGANDMLGLIGQEPKGLQWHAIQLGREGLPTVARLELQLVSGSEAGAAIAALRRELDELDAMLDDYEQEWDALHAERLRAGDFEYRGSGSGDDPN